MNSTDLPGDGWKLYRKKPAVVAARRWFSHDDLPDIVKPMPKGTSGICVTCGGKLEHHGVIETLEGTHIVCPGDWIIRGVAGEFYPVKPWIFDETYDEYEVH